MEFDSVTKTYLSDKKESIGVEVGDSKQTVFYPQIKISAWDNEANFSLRFTSEIADSSFEQKDSKVEWTKKDGTVVSFYERKDPLYEEFDGFEFEFKLLKKPTTNQFLMSIETKGFAFQYQPELTEAEKKNGAYRPDNVVGSYAVFHSTKRDGAKYKAGKVLHIYRPYAEDAMGECVWCSMSIDVVAKTMLIEIPQDFLDSAVYPIVVDPTFGYTSIGGSWQEYNQDQAFGGKYASNATTEIDSLTFYAKRSASDGTTPQPKIVMWGGGSPPASILTNGVGPAISVTDLSGAWYTVNYSSKPSVSNGTAYRLGAIQDVGYSTINVAYDGTVEIDPNNYATPEAYVPYNNQPTFQPSVYATYTSVITPNGIASSESFGSPSIGLQVRPSSVVSLESFGSPTILPGNVNVTPDGIVSAEALGSPTVNLSISISSIDSGEAMGIPTLMYDQEITLDGIASEEAFGLIKIDMSIKFAGAIASAEAWGSPFLTVGIVYIDAIGIVSEETFGLPSVVPGSAFVVPNSIPSGEAFGSLSLGIGIVPSSIASGEAFGSLTILSGGVSVSPDSILSSEGFGTPTLLPGNVNISVFGIASGQSFGSPTILRGTVYIQAQSIATSESWGSPSIVPMTAFVNPNGIASAGAFGTPSLDVGYVDISPYGITSVEGFGSPYVTAMGVQVSPFSIDSDEALGEPSVIPGGVVITLQSISSGELFGAPALLPGTVYITPDGIASSETFGSVNVVQSIRVDTIVSEEGFGSPTITTGNVNVSPNGIASQEAFGSHIVRNVLVIYLNASGIDSSESFGLPTIINIVRNAFQELMESDLEQGFFNLGEFAEIVVYIHKDGTTIQLPVIFDQDTVMVDPNTGAEILSRQPMIQAQTSDFYVTPDKGDKVIVRGVRYQVITYEPDGTGVASLRLHHERTV